MRNHVRKLNETQKKKTLCAIVGFLLTGTHCFDIVDMTRASSLSELFSVVDCYALMVNMRRYV